MLRRNGPVDHEIYGVM